MNKIKTDYIKIMFSQAKAAMHNAYAPYSKFQVGCCIRAEEDQFFTGANVENVSYPCTQCAEASAIGSMIAAGYKQIKEVLVICNSNRFCTPCGNCRQRLIEFSQPTTMVHICDKEELRKSIKLIDLLPDAFAF